MKSLFEEMGGTYRQEGDYLIPNLALPDEPRIPDRQVRAYAPQLSEKNIVRFSMQACSQAERCIGTLPRSTKPATSVWQSSFPIWQGRKM